MKDETKYFMHTPASLSTGYVRWAEQLQSGSTISYGCAMDKVVLPLHPGDMMAVVARPGHGKSSWMAYMARKEAQAIVDRGEEREVVVYVSWEQPVEEIEAFFQSGKDYSSSDFAWGRVPLERIRKNAIKRPSLPVWMIGTSIHHANIKKPRLTVDLVYKTIESMYDEFQVKPTLVCLDYIQKIPVHRTASRLDQVTEATFAAKELAMQIGAPILVGVQASRNVDNYKLPVPTLADAQWSSAIEQTADKQIAVWRPAKTHDPNETPYIPIGGTDYRNSDELFVIKLLKQRFEQGFGVWPVHFKPQTLELTDYSNWR